MNPLEKLLAEAREAPTLLSMETGVPVEPRLALVFSMASVLLLAVGGPPLFLVAGLVVSLGLLAYAGWLRGYARGCLELLLYPLLVSTVSALPLALAMGRWWDAFSLVARTVSSSAFLLAYTMLVGWSTMVYGLEALGAPHTVARSIMLAAYYLPRFIGDLASMLAARRARTLGAPGLRAWWRLLATCTGELLLRGYHTALQVTRAVEARSLGSQVPHPRRVEGYPLLPLAPCILVVACWVAASLAG